MNKNQFIYNSLKLKYHRSHIVTPSPWSVFASLGALILITGSVLLFQNYTEGSSLMNNTLFIRESIHLGYHTSVIPKGLCMGVVLFIVSEVMFFFAFFLVFFHAKITLNVDSDMNIISSLYFLYIFLLSACIPLVLNVIVILNHSLCVAEVNPQFENKKSFYRFWIIGYILSVMPLNLFRRRSLKRNYE